MAESKKFGVKNIVFLSILAVALILIIVGFSINWLTLSGGGQTESYKLAKLVEDNKTYKTYMGSDLYANIGAVNTLAIFSIVFSVLALAVYAVSSFVNLKVFKVLTLVFSICLIVFAALTLILSFTIGTSDYLETSRKAGGSVVPAVGAWLLAIGGIAGGVVGIVASRK